MADSKIQEVPVQPLTALGSILGVRDNGDTTFTDIRVTSAGLTAYLLEATRKTITALTANISDGGKSLTDTFFSNSIDVIEMNNQVYFRDEDFTQAGTKITMIDNGFIDGKKLKARL